MIRPARETQELSNEEFAKAYEPADIEIRSYLKDELLYNFYARYLATYYNHDAIWEDSNLEYELKDAKMDLSTAMEQTVVDLDKLNSILEKKHSLRITSANPIRIEEIQ